MKIVNVIKYVLYCIRDPERDFSERVFLILTLISELTVPLALVADIITGEHLQEILVLIGVVIIVPTITLVCLYKNRLTLAIRMIVISLVLFILPALYFFGGGLEGGGVVWIIFGFTYVGLTMSGRWRRVMLFLLFIMSGICFLSEYFHPEWVTEHSRWMLFVDSFISFILVGFVCFYMTWSQNQLFMKENERARKAAETAEELTRAQNRFFSSMSHEIRTPINSILGLNELILRDQSASDEVVRDATGIQGAGKLLLALINDILDFSKMEAGSMDIVPVDYRVGDLISEVVGMIWLKAQDKGLRFDVSIDPKVPTVLFGDEIRIKQVIINLLNNAVKYTKEGSIELHIDSEETDEKTALLTITISDTGMGIKKEALPHLFDAFKRVDEEKNRHIEGTGLGLSIVKQLVELMDGTIAVSSIYGEGSIFTVTLKQGITDPTQIGELNIHNQQTAKRSRYESSFTAPDARILIVDDNEMNLEVESKLLAETHIHIDKALSGRDALELTLQNHYDVILMDHLMPMMDGIECLEHIRSQDGGLNRTVPVVVLTANAGSENRDLYNRSGFDGYLMKPVSGEALEEMLMRHITRDKLIISGRMMRMREDISATAGYARKQPVIITSTSMCDLPDAVVRKLGIPILPFVIHTDEGTFKDGVQMDASEMIRYVRDGKNAVSSPPDVKTYTEFFAGALKKGHHLIHIALTTSMSEDYKIATEAAKSFDNVTVINSEVLSSATGILVLIACKLAQQNIPLEEIIEELNTVKQRLRCSFVIDTTEYMAERGLISKRLDRIARTLSLHPGLRIRNDRSGIGGVWIGRTKRAYRKYIHHAFPVDIIPDGDVVFITYADVPLATLEWIREEISKIAYFEHVVFKQASAAISSNCGPGAVGILYFVKSNKSYNIGSFIEDETSFAHEEFPEEIEDEEGSADAENTEEPAPAEPDASAEPAWYEKLTFIDGEAAIRNSGSEDAFRSVLKIFHGSIPDKTAELENFYTSADWQNYVIKIHALKSSAKLIGALALSDKAQLLETAGKEGNTDYIRENHASFMKDYAELGSQLDAVMAEESGSDKPVADDDLMVSVFEELRAAAEAMDCDTIGGILQEMEAYAIPETDRERYDAVTEAAGKFDYEGMLAALDQP
ncbi:MAG: DegV family EDD domain-containing protein [Lachnospiraceae bacterium]|nr:DegV family EDD domain-containing protein [Lachnospiraceae bacterium]